LLYILYCFVINTLEEQKTTNNTSTGLSRFVTDMRENLLSYVRWCQRKRICYYIVMWEKFITLRGRQNLKILYCNFLQRLKRKEKNRKSPSPTQNELLFFCYASNAGEFYSYAGEFIVIREKIFKCGRLPLKQSRKTT